MIITTINFDVRNWNGDYFLVVSPIHVYSYTPVHVFQKFNIK